MPTTSKASSTFTTGTGYTPGPRNTYTYRAITSLSDEHSSGSLADTFLFKHPNTTGTITYGFPKLTNASGVALWTQEAMWDYGDGPIHTFYFEVTYNGGDSTAITPTYTTDKPTKGEMSGPGQYFAFGKNYSDVTELVLVAEDGWYDTDDAADNPGIGYISTTELAKIGSPLNDKYNMTLSEFRACGEPVVNVDVEVTATSPLIAPNGESTTTVTAINTGESGATDVTVRYTPPTGITIVQAKLPSNCTLEADGTAACQVGDIATNGEVTVDLPLAATDLPTGTVSGGSTWGSFTGNDPDGSRHETSVVISDCDVSDLAGDCDGDGNANGTDPNPAAAVAGDDRASATAGTATTINLLDNDDYSPGPNTTITIISATGGTPTLDAATGELTYTPSDAEKGQTVEVEYTVCNTDPETVCSTATARFEVPGAVDVEVAVTPGNEVPIGPPGAEVDLSLSYGNTGENTAQDAVIVYTPPEGVTIVSVDSPNCSIDRYGKVTCRPGDLAPGSLAGVGMKAKIDASAAPNSTLGGGTVNATFTGDDPNGASAPHSLTTQARATNISIVAVPPAPIPPGGTGEVELQISQLGPSDGAERTTVTYQPPTGTTIAADSVPSNCELQTDGSLSCDLPPLAADDKRLINFDLRVPGDAEPGPLTGGLASASNPEDLDLTDNEATSEVRVGEAQADLQIGEVEQPTLSPGESGILHVEVVNHGPSAATDAVLTYELPTGIDLDPTNTGPCSQAERLVTCPVRSPLEVGIEQISIPLLLDSDWPPGDSIPNGTLGLTAATVDPNGDNNGAAAAPVLRDDTGTADPTDPGISGPPTLNPSDETPDDNSPMGLADSGAPQLNLGVYVTLLVVGVALILVDRRRKANQN